MVTEIAQGLVDPIDIAYRYGYSRSEFEQLAKSKVFCADVAIKRAEFERGGQSIKIKAQLMTEHLLDDLFLMAKDGTIGQVQETIKILSKLGDLEPRNTQVQTASGPAFSISINIPEVGVIKAQTIEMQSPVPVIDVPVFNETKPDTDEKSI
jgi:hypothetical protein